MTLGTYVNYVLPLVMIAMAFTAAGVCQWVRRSRTARRRALAALDSEHT